MYGLRPEEFTAARDAHAAAARKAGQRAEAKRIAALHKPTLAVWAANRLARADADQAQHLLELGRGLREAHRTLSGEDLRKLSHQQHVVITAMAGEARRLAGEAGQDLSAGVQREVEQILRSVLADPEAASTWARGVLDKAPPPAVGFAEVAPAPGTAPRPQQPERRMEPEPEPEPESEPDDTQEAERTSREAELAEEALALAETEREVARAGLGALDEQIAGLEERLGRAREERERLAAVAEAAERSHEDAVREAKRARTAARRGRRR
ncbi:hypothetical protein ADK93_13290 [Streptomyces sp. XY58]|nr:hypothetical protein ADK93_13290 [Streptomyces sp. XY58]KOV07064.1 hypothetical protein ADK89_12780 [Streptomyces sp. XY37]KOV49365.1 hypothetical protein ADK99_13300 [Streptomyces sp. MMG1064]